MEGNTYITQKPVGEHVSSLSHAAFQHTDVLAKGLSTSAERGEHGTAWRASGINRGSAATRGSQINTDALRPLGDA